MEVFKGNRVHAVYPVGKSEVIHIAVINVDSFRLGLVITRILSSCACRILSCACRILGSCACRILGSCACRILGSCACRSLSRACCIRRILAGGGRRIVAASCKYYAKCEKNDKKRNNLFHNFCQPFLSNFIWIDFDKDKTGKKYTSRITTRSL